MKKLKLWLVVSAVCSVLFTGLVFAVSTPQINYNFGLFNEMNEQLTSGYNVQIYTAGTSSAPTIYSDQQCKTALDNPIDIADGVNFFTAASTVDVVIYDTPAETTRIRKSSFTPVQHRIVFPVIATEYEKITSTIEDLEVTGTASIAGDATVHALLTAGGGIDTVGATNDIVLKNDATIVNTSADLLTITEPTITLAGATKINLSGPTDVSGVLSLASTGAFGAWGYTGEHVALTDGSSNTNAGSGEYFEISSTITAGKVMAGEYSRLMVRTSQANQCTLVGTESQFRLYGVDLANGVHSGLWAYAEQSGTSTLSDGGTFDAISATVESASTFTVGATEFVTGITIDSSIDSGASIDASANFSGIYIKSNGLDWFRGIKITGCDTDVELSNGATINVGAETTRAGINTALGARTAGSLYLSSAGKLYVCVDNLGADTSWEVVTQTTAD